MSEAPARFERVLRPGSIGELRLPHRIITGAMHLGIEALDDGGEALAAFYLARVRGGAGLLVTGGVAVSRVGAGGPHYALIDEVAHRTALARVARAVHGAGGLIALQLFHAGRYAFERSFGLTPVAPSAVFSRYANAEPDALSVDAIDATIEDFARASAIARELGYDAVELMGSEGYLIDQFLSPFTNRRDDEWGGDATRRQRFGVEVTTRVRERVGADFPVIVRFSGDDLMPEGTPRDEVLAFARALASAGADALNVGVGWHEAPVPTVQMMVPSGYWAPVATAVKAAVGETPVIASNRVNRLETAEALLQSTSLDFISMARPFLADPDLIEHSRAGAPINVCIACNQACIDRSLVDERVSCLVNPRAGHELDVVATPRRRRGRSVAVVGGGPAGLSAALALVRYGYAVELFEAAPVLGGQFRFAARVPAKADYANTVHYYEHELHHGGARIHLDRTMGVEDLDYLGTLDAVVVATGVRPRTIDLPGATLPHVLTYAEAFEGARLGERVVIIGGGGIAVDLAYFASAGEAQFDPEHFRSGTSPTPSGRRVTIVLRGARLAPAIGRSTRWALLAELRQRAEAVESGVHLERVERDCVVVVNAEGTSRTIRGDTVVMAVGQERERRVADALARELRNCHVVGGARDVVALDAVRAFSEGLAAADEIARSSR